MIIVYILLFIVLYYLFFKSSDSSEEFRPRRHFYGRRRGYRHYPRRRFFGWGVPWWRRVYGSDEGWGVLWNKVGVVYSQDKNEDSIYSLYEMRMNNTMYRYKVKDGWMTLKINKGKNMRKLESGDIIKITGKEKIGDFVVELY